MRKTLLVVDDDEPVLRVAEDALIAMNYTVLATSDPQRAIRIAKEQPVDLLISDVVMPIMCGTDLADRIQAVKPSIKVLLMSGYPTADVTHSGRPFMDKPFDIEELARRVRETLDRPSAFARRTARSD